MKRVRIVAVPILALLLCMVFTLQVGFVNNIQSLTTLPISGNIQKQQKAVVGQLYVNGMPASSGYYNAQSISFRASGAFWFANCFVIKDNVQIASYANGSDITEEGLYTFFAVDALGQSPKYTIVLDRTAPQGMLYAGSNQASNGAITNAGFVTYTAVDNYALATIYVQPPKSITYTTMTSGYQWTTDGAYTFYSVDRAGNTSRNMNIILDKTPPVGRIIANNTLIPSGSTTDSDFCYYANDATTSVVKVELIRPNGKVENYTPSTIIPSTSINGQYTFRAIDQASNVSESSVYLETENPIAYLYADDMPVGNQTYTNASRISMSATGLSNLQCFVKLPDSEVFVPYSQFVSLYASGRYEFYAMDESQNQSNIVWIVVDRESKSIELNGVADSVANGDVVLEWDEYNKDTQANIVSITVNGKDYYKYNDDQQDKDKHNPIIQTINNGIYQVESIDQAGNVWTTQFVSNRLDILSSTMNVEYYETYGNYNNYYSFETQLNATTFATERENTLVKIGNWNSGSWDGGIPIDEVDKENAQYGQYYIYKSSTNANQPVAYFTKSRLDIVVNQYATQSVKSYYFWQKELSTIYDGNDLYNLSKQNIYVGTQVELANNAHYLIDGQSLDSNNATSKDTFIYNQSGLHFLTVYDNYGNSYEYELRIIDTPSDVYYKLKDGDYNRTIDGIDYTLDNEVTLKVSDDLSLDYAMLIVKNTNGEQLSILQNNQEYTITQTGKYIVQSINLFGYSEEVVFDIIIDNTEIESTPPTAELIGVKNSGKTKGTVTLTNPSKPVTILAYKDNIQFDYAFGQVLSEVGQYTITLTDADGNTATYTFEIVYEVNAAGYIVIVLVILAVASILIVVISKRKLRKKRVGRYTPKTFKNNKPTSK